MNKKISVFLVLLFSVSTLAGCIEPEMEAVEDEIAICTEGNMPEWSVGCAFPSFDLMDQNGTHWNESAVNESGRWVAYFSASWCTHCKPTINALDESIMQDHLLVINKHESNDSSNMTKWHLTMEEELNRSINRPFLHAPSLAANLSVTSIPHVLLIENNTILSARVGLWDSAHEMSMWFNATSPQSGYTQSMNMDNME
ncbi:MAG TPA: thioredoxin family protein [Candidatus Poseidoniaceae archaeon]|nr:MAG TPA: thioredoxin [Candidatus Poseidoniales archaeon]HII11637.1 thioredoxin family protein [Candidatus Poseidoniaceae archaeon]|tara:strand:- start:720 stop:1316 length:597 start_codon:yes stop_codon:yes gene_type:complete